LPNSGVPIIAVIASTTPSASRSRVLRLGGHSLITTYD
jgi:hypothetical protein